MARSVMHMNALLAVCRRCDKYPACPAAQKVRDEATVCPLEKWDNGLPIGEFIKKMLAPGEALAAGMGFQMKPCVDCDGRRRRFNRAGKKLARFVGK